MPVKSQISHAAWAEEADGCFKQATTQTGLCLTQFVMWKFLFYIQGGSNAATGITGVLLGRVSLHCTCTSPSSNLFCG